MSTLQFKIDESLVQAMGMEAIQGFVERQLVFLHTKYLGETIARAIEETGFSHEKEVEAARQEAWQEYQSKYLPPT
jgi:hypothetical protein